MALPVVFGLSLSACGPKKEETHAEAQGLECVGDWLASFIGAIPLPGFSILGKVGKATATTVTGVLKDSGKTAAQGLCGAAATFSDQQMQQMKQALKDAFNEQNHRDATALMNKIEIKFNEHVADEDRYTDYTMSHLQTIVDDSNDWITKYDQSGTRIHNVEDLVIVGGYTLKAYQQIIREVALEAAKTQSAGDADKVRKHAANLANKAKWLREKLDYVSNNETMGVAKSFWKNNAESQTKKYFAGPIANAHCYESTDGNPYDASGGESGRLRKPRFINAINGAKDLSSLSDYARKNGTICCMDGICNSNDDERIESSIASYLDVTNKQVKKVMFYDKPGIMNFFNQTLPLFVDVGAKLQEADDATIFALAAATGSPEVVSQDSGTVNPAAIPACKTAGYGDAFQCGNGQTCKKDSPTFEESSICTVNSGSDTGACDYSKASENNGWGYNPTTKESCKPL